jgi:hypothetical protein
VGGGRRTIKAEFAQDDTYFFEGCHGRLGRPDRHAGAACGIERPGGNHGSRAVGDVADENDFTSSPHLPVLNVDVSAEGRMPWVVESRTKWDMGGITLDW